ncbi:hypothetical protein C1I95_32475 [Micromonospora craterilacus]|uniref:Uncharacterized protein n=1 Tax=Micromonospora craterilacus TaxID=1655439 RepID=A0A2W2DXG0_9ACTN|nr:hypothetical protein C1I95_32475 [Micromonospora craterilacus]
METAEQLGLEDEPRTWWFTFPQGSAYAGRYAVTHGVYDAARAEVTRHFGPTFAGQFASSEEAGVAHAGMLRLRRDQWPAPVDQQTAVPAGEDNVFVNPGGLVQSLATGEWRRPGDADTALMSAIDPAAPPAEAAGDAGGYRLTEAGEQALTAGDEPATPAVDEQAGPHRMAAGWKGEPGECGAECACGVTYDGFDSLGAASELLDRHIAIANQSALPPVPAGELRTGMFVATGDMDAPGMEVRHVELAEDGHWVGVVYAGPSYSEYRVNELLFLVDAEAVEQAAARAKARAHRAQQIECLRQLAQLAEQDEFFPLPRYTLRIGGGLDSPEAVRRFAAVLDVEAVEQDYGLRATWRYGGDELNPPVEVEVSAAHPRSAGAKSTPVPVPVSSPPAPPATEPPPAPAVPAAEPATTPDPARRCCWCGATSGLAMLPHGPDDPVAWACADATCPQVGAR